MRSISTSALLAHLEEPLELSAVFRRVRVRVLESTDGQQRPHEYGSLLREHYLSGVSGQAPVAVAAAAGAAARLKRLFRRRGSSTMKTLRKAALATGIILFAAADGSGQVLEVDQHGVLVAEDLDRVTLSLSGFSDAATSAIVQMVGEHDAAATTDGPLCRAIRPDSISVPLSAGAGTVEWQFSNRFDGRYRLRCRIRATADGQTADARIHTVPVNFYRQVVTLTPSTVSVGVTTFVDVEAYIEQDYSDGTVRSAFRVDSPPVLQTGEGCDGVEPDSLQLTPTSNPAGFGARWAVNPRYPVSNCVVKVDADDSREGFHAQATLTAMTRVPALPLAGVLLLGGVLALLGRRRS